MKPHIQPAMKQLITVLALIAAFALPAGAAPKKPAAKPDAEKAPAGPADLTGRYERAGDEKSIFILHIRQNGDRADMDFSASKADGTGAAPEGKGKGALNDKGELEFTFDDSFGNRGTAVMTKTKTGYQLSIKAETVTEPRAVKFYGVIALKRTVDREN